MFNQYRCQKAKILKTVIAGKDIKRFWLELESPIEYRFGQFIMARVSGFGEGPFAPCGEWQIGGNKHIELAIRKVGVLTEKLHSLDRGNFIEMRGPFGNGCWPNTCRNTLIVVGGLGLVPLRSLIANYVKIKPNYKMQIFYGARSPEDFMFREDFNSWKKADIDLNLTIDEKCSGWKGCVGLVTDLFKKTAVLKDAQCFICGPPVMYKFVLEKLKENGFKNSEIYVSLERRMHCGVGVCQHCAVGSDYVCKDGPVFQWSEIKKVYNLM